MAGKAIAEARTSIEQVGGGKVRGEGYTAALFVPLTFHYDCWMFRKGIVAVTHNIGVVPQNFRRYLSLFAKNTAAGSCNTV